MGYKKWGKEISFADLAVSKSLEHNRSLKMMERIEKVVSWRDVEALLMEHYETGTSDEGADAYPALMLCLRPIGPTARWEGAFAAEVVSTPSRRGLRPGGHSIGS